MIDYIIVGAGLSGIAVADELLKRGKSIIVFENYSQSSSAVAGGVYNPVILKRFTLAWNAGMQLNKALPFYRSLEDKLDTQLMEELPVYRKFSSVEEQNNWFEAMDKPALAPFLDPSLASSVNDCIPSRFSFGRVRKTGKLDTGLLLKKYRGYLDEMGILLEERFEYAALEFSREHISYKKIKARRIIFCEGYGMVHNPFFNFIPLRGNKGEYLIIKAPGLKLDVAVKSSIFILPQGKDLYKVGATYDNSGTTEEPTAGAREKLVEQVEKLITCDFEVIDQVAGIRPATVDRKPVIGRHPEHRQLFCCNGFGSRGVIIAPSMAKELVDFLEDEIPLSPETDLGRFL